MLSNLCKQAAVCAYGNDRLNLHCKQGHPCPKAEVQNVIQRVVYFKEQVVAL